MSNSSDELSRIFAGLKQFEQLDLLTAGKDTASAFNSFIDRLDELGYDVEEFRITDNDYKMVGALDRQGRMRNPRPSLQYGVLKRKHGALMEYFHIREKAIITGTSLSKKSIT